MNNTAELALILNEVRRREQITRYLTLFADEKMYPKHRLFMAAGKHFKQKLFIAGNRVGKSTVAACELVMHLTGVYPDWWEGHRFTSANQWWVIGKNSELIKQSLQPMLIGTVGNFGSGLVPASALDFDTLVDAKRTNTLITSFRVKHVNGGFSTVEFKSAAAGRAALQAVERSVWIDEECGSDIYEECLLRTMTGTNILMMTFTPLMGLTELILNYYGQNFRAMDGEVSNGRYAVNCTWDEAPHLSQSAKDLLWASLPPNQREARSKGIPSLGAGAIYPVAESEYVVDPFEIPAHYKRCYALDVGWKFTAVTWGAIDPETDTLYIYADYKVSEQQPAIHAAAIKAKGQWIPGIIDSAANGSSQVDGKKLKQLYEDLGLATVNANKAVETGIYQFWEGLTAGKIKVFSTCQKFLEEIRVYRRDSKGQIVKINDHLCLAEGTMITTSRGQVPIEHVTTNDYVLTRDGFKRVIASWQTGTDQTVYRVKSSSGAYVDATIDHPIFVNQVFTPVGDLHKYLLESTKGAKCQPKLSTVEYRGTEVSTRNDTQTEPITKVKPVLNNLVKHSSIGLSTKTPRDQSLKDIMSTISTAIQTTTCRTTSKQSPSKNTEDNTNSVTLKSTNNNELNTLTVSEILPKSGTPAKQGLNGTDSTQLTPGLHNVLSSSSHATNATISMNLEQTAGSYTFVVDAVVVGITELTLKQNVYNIQVADCPEYFANGILTHNCDSSRYLNMGREHFKTRQQQKQPIYQTSVSPSARVGW